MDKYRAELLALHLVTPLDATSCNAPDARKLPQTTHLRDYPERVTITRSHHPFEGGSLEVLRHAVRQERLYFVLILPDGSKSLIPADWTDYSAASPSQTEEKQLIGSLEDLLQLRFLADALLQRAATSATQFVSQQESHAATESELSRHPDSGEEHKQLVIETLARLMVNAVRTGKPQEAPND